MKNDTCKIFSSNILNKIVHEVGAITIFFIVNTVSNIEQWAYTWGEKIGRQYFWAGSEVHCLEFWSIWKNKKPGILIQYFINEYCI